jgi:hypothetical protein
MNDKLLPSRSNDSWIGVPFLEWWFPT